MTPEERASNVVAYLIGTAIPDHILENLRRRIVNEINWALVEERTRLCKEKAVEDAVNTELDYGDKDRPRLSKELSE